MGNRAEGLGVASVTFSGQGWFEMKVDPKVPLANEATEEGYDAFFSKDTHEAYQHHFLTPKESRILFVQRTN